VATGAVMEAALEAATEVATGVAMAAAMGVAAMVDMDFSELFQVDMGATVAAMEDMAEAATEAMVDPEDMEDTAAMVAMAVVDMEATMVHRWVALEDITEEHTDDQDICTDNL